MHKTPVINIVEKRFQCTQLSLFIQKAKFTTFSIQTDFNRQNDVISDTLKGFRHTLMTFLGH